MEASPEAEIEFPAPAKRKIGRRSKIIIVSSVFIALIVIAGMWVYVINVGIGGCGCSTPAIAMNKGSTASNWTFTVMAVSSASSIKLTDIYIVVQTVDGTVIIPGTNLSSFVADGSVYYHGVSFHNPSLGSHDYLSVGYEITVDRTEYASGAGFGLFTKDGNSQYGVYYSPGDWNSQIHWVAPPTIDWNFVVAVVVLIVFVTAIASMIVIRKKKSVK